MKKLALLLLLGGISFINAVSQSAGSFKYQAILRTPDGTIMANSNVIVEINILQGTINGTSSYMELDTVLTNMYGLINLEIGSKNPGLFAGINWSTGPYYISISVNGTNIGTNQILSVPYALYALKAGNGFSGDYNDLSNKPVNFDGSWNSISGKPIFSLIATTGDYNDILNKPGLFSGNYIDLSNKPVLFNGVYDSLSYKPDLKVYAKNSRLDSVANLLLNLPTVDFAYSIVLSADSTFFTLSADDASSNYSSAITLHQWYVNGLPATYYNGSTDTTNVPHMRDFYNSNGHYSITHSITVDGKVFSKGREFDMVGIKP